MPTARWRPSSGIRWTATRRTERSIWRKQQQTVAMFVSKQVIEKLEGEQTELRREVKYLRRAVERGDNMAVKAHAEDLASRIENHASLVDAVLEAVSEDKA